MISWKFQKKPKTVIIKNQDSASKPALKWPPNKRQTQAQKKIQNQMKRAEKKQAIYKQQMEAIDAKRRSSGRLSCDKCFRDFTRMCFLEKHKANPGSCVPSKRATRGTRAKKGKPTFGTSLKDNIANIVSDEKFLGRATIVGPKLQSCRTDSDFNLIDGKEKVYPLVSGTMWAATPQLFPAGFARRWNIRGAFRYSDSQKKFLTWAFQYGEKNPKQKFTASLAAQLMQIVGTEEAAQKYPDLEKSADGGPAFKWAELVSRYEIKTFFGTMQQNKKKKSVKEANSKK